MKKLSEIMAAKALKKEQRRAEMEAQGTEQDGAVLTSQIARSTFPVVLPPIAELVRSFASDEGRERFRSRFTPKQKKLLDSIEGQIDDAWLIRAADFLVSIPAGRGVDARRITWKEWIEFGAAFGWPENDVLGTLRLVFVLSAQTAQSKAQDILARNRA